MNIKLITLMKAMRGTHAYLIKFEKKMAKQRGGSFVPSGEVLELTAAILHLENDIQTINDVKLALAYVDDIERGAFGDANGVIHDDGEMPETTLRIKAYRSVLNDLLCTTRGRHNFSKSRIGLPESRCLDCGVTLADFKWQAKAVTI